MTIDPLLNLLTDLRAHRTLPHTIEITFKENTTLAKSVLDHYARLRGETPDHRPDGSTVYSTYDSSCRRSVTFVVDSK